MMRVVCAIIENSDGKFLMAQRSANMTHAYHWEFAGGKVQPGESDEAAIQREIWEELRIEVRTIQKLTPVTYEYPDKKIVLVAIICEIRLGTIALTEHIDYNWVTLQEMDRMTVPGADRQVVKLLKDRYEN